MAEMEKSWKQADPNIMIGPKIYGAKVREILKGKYEVIPKTKEHIKVDRTSASVWPVSFATSSALPGLSKWKTARLSGNTVCSCAGSAVCATTYVLWTPLTGITRKREPAW